MDVNALPLELTRPWMLWGLLFALPVLLYSAWVSLVDFSARQRLVSLGIRSLMVVLLVLALAGLNRLDPTSRRFVVFAVDESLSIGAEARKTALRYLDKAARQASGHEVRFLPFASRPRGLSTELPASRGEVARPSDGVSPADGDSFRGSEQDREYRMGSDLASAIQVAAASIPPSFVPRIVLLSDGNQTRGEAAAAALAAGVPVSVVPLPARSEMEVQVTAVNVPAQVRRGEPFHVEVVIDSNHEDTGFVELYRGPHRVETVDSARKRKIQPGENRFHFQENGVDQRQVRYTARIRGFQDHLLDNNTASGLVFTAGEPRVLLIDSDASGARHLSRALGEHDILVDVRPAEGVPRSLTELQGYEALILADVPATSLSIRQMEILRHYVQHLGGGLIMLGSDQSFGLGGYSKTTLEELLPVRGDFEKEREEPSLAMVLAVDKSGSMGGMKMELAKDATRAAVELLGPRDSVGVIAFDGASYWVSELGSAAGKQSVLDRVRSVQASGGTSIYPALEDALAALQAAVARLKHVVLLTDGHSSPGDFDGITRRMAAAGITVSTVAVGEDADQTLMERIARLGNGRHYFCEDPRSVPQIFAKETVTAGRSAIYEEPFLPRLVQPSPFLRGISVDEAPFLLGYVKTRAKPTSELILAAETGDPLLAWWRYGLGVSLAFTSDARNRWASEWLAWPDFGKFWAHVVRHVMRRVDSSEALVQLRRRGALTEVVVDAVDDSGRFRNAASTRLAVIRPDLTIDELTVPQVAPGRYAVELPTAERGTYHLELSQHSGGREVMRQSRGFEVGYPDELRIRAPDNELLRSVAEVSGGGYNPPPGELFEADDRRASRSHALWPWLLAATAVLLVFDVAMRRIDFESLASHRAGADRRDGGT